MRTLLCLGLFAACGGPPEPGGDDAAGTTDASARADGPQSDGSAGDDAPPADASVADARPDARPDAPPPLPDAFPGVLDMRINCRNDCVLIANPPSIAVPSGTSFEVNWINVGDTECDVAKIDPFNHVPIIIGLEPGTSYHDPVHEWCGIFTGTFDFRVSICTIHSYIPVDCSAP